MPRLIDADALLFVLGNEYFPAKGEFARAMDIVRFAIKDAPTIDPESLRPTGEWISTVNPQWPAYSHDKCSICGWWNTKNALCYGENKRKGHSLNYCPNCGAMMKEDT